MLNNNLSNAFAPVLCFSFERVVCEKVSKPLFGGYKFELNWQNVNAIDHLWKKDFIILYVTFTWPDKRIDQLEDDLDRMGCLYSGVMKVKDNASLKTFLRHNLGSAYYDTDKEIVDNLYPNAFLWQGYLISLWNKE
jgi:hypothetical protein